MQLSLGPSLAEESQALASLRSAIHLWSPYEKLYTRFCELLHAGGECASNFSLLFCNQAKVLCASYT